MVLLSIIATSCATKTLHTHTVKPWYWDLGNLKAKSTPLTSLSLEDKIANFTKGIPRSWRSVSLSAYLVICCLLKAIPGQGRHRVEDPRVPTKWDSFDFLPLPIGPAHVLMVLWQTELHSLVCWIGPPDLAFHGWAPITCWPLLINTGHCRLPFLLKE